LISNYFFKTSIFVLTFLINKMMSLRLTIWHKQDKK
jgi:hypothetical protein